MIWSRPERTHFLVITFENYHRVGKIGSHFGQTIIWVIIFYFFQQKTLILIQKKRTELICSRIDKTTSKLWRIHIKQQNLKVQSRIFHSWNISLLLITSFLYNMLRDIHYIQVCMFKMEFLLLPIFAFIFNIFTSYRLFLQSFLVPCIFYQHIWVCNMCVYTYYGCLLYFWNLTSNNFDIRTLSCCLQ